MPAGTMSRTPTPVPSAARTRSLVLAAYLGLALIGPAVSVPHGWAQVERYRRLGDPYYPRLGNAGYDVQHYDIMLRIDPKRRVMAGETAIRLTATTGLAIFSLDFLGFKLGAVTVDDTPARVERASVKLRIMPAPALVTGQTVDVIVRYHGKPAKPVADLGWFRRKDGGALLNT